MSAHSDPFRLALLTGLTTGFGDLLALEILGGFRSGYVSTASWFWIPCVWTVVCVMTSALFSIGPLRRLRTTALLFAGPGMLVLSRGGPALKHATRISIASATTSALVAGIVLCAAIAWMVRRNESVVNRWTNAAIAMSVLLLLAGAGRSMANRRAKGDAASSGRSANVVLIFLDTVRYDDAETMPNLQAFASQSTVFDNAWAPAPWTLPSHFAVFTGLDPWNVRFDSHRMRFDDAAPTIAEEFARRGYATAAILANPIFTPSVGLARGFQRLEDSPPLPPCRSGIGYLFRQVYFRSERSAPVCRPLIAGEVIASAVDFIERQKGPYLLTLNLNDAHHPYSVERECRDARLKGYTDAEGQQLRSGMNGGALPSEDALLRIHEQYRAAMRCMDRSLGNLFRTLEKRPDWDRTIVAVLSDHGEQFGEHGFVGHGNSVYAQVLHVPLLVRRPGFPPQRISDPVSISDLHGTLLGVLRTPAQPHGLFGARRPVVAKFSFVGISPKTFAVCAVGPSEHLLHWDSGREELYNYRTDPAESRPLSVPSNSDPIAELRELLRPLNRTAEGASLFRSLGYIH